jgi:hypothetical protein
MKSISGSSRSAICTIGPLMPVHPSNVPVCSPPSCSSTMMVLTL